MDDAYKTQAQGKVEQTLTFAPGEIVEVAKKYFVIACGTDALQIQNLQPEGKKPMDTVAILKGIRKDKFDMYKNNPEEFIPKVTRLIKEPKRKQD